MDKFTQVSRGAHAPSPLKSGGEGSGTHDTAKRMHDIRSGFLSWMLAVILCLGMVPLMPQAAYADENAAPRLKEGVAPTAVADILVGGKYALNLSTIFEDPEGGSLTYTVSIDGAAAVNAPTRYSYAPTSSGTATLVFKASNGTVESTDTYTVTLTILDAIPIDEAHFPDAVWRDYVNTTFAGGDGILTAAEAQAVVQVSVNNKSITSLKGVEYFTNATSLGCDNNLLTALEVGALTKLTVLSCNGNQLTALDVGALVNLTQLVCNYNQLTSLDARALTVLQTLTCSGNKLYDVGFVSMPGMPFPMVMGESQVLSIPVKATPQGSSAYESISAYPLFAGHTMTVSGDQAAYDADTGLFRLDSLEGATFMNSMGSSLRFVSGTLTFVENFAVTFVDWDDTVLKTDFVENGAAATPPADPMREGYTFTGWDKDFSQITGDLTVTAVYTEDEHPIPPLDRLAGKTAPDTAAAVSQEAFPDGAETVIIARADDFADAMSAAGLAGVLDAPILLTDRNSLSAATAEEIQRLGASEAYIIGGTGAITPMVNVDLAELDIKVKPRVSGKAAWDTSVACANLIGTLGGAQDKVIVAMSTNFQDALSISSFAYAHKVPIYLQTATGDRPLPSEAIDAIKALPEATIFVPGGNGAVKPSTVEEVFDNEVVRIAGKTGYDTSNEVAHYMVENQYLSASQVSIASGALGAKGVDALAGAALAGRAGGVLLLTNGNAELEPVDETTLNGFLTDNATQVEQAYVLGGTYVMPQATYDRIRDILS